MASDDRKRFNDLAWWEKLGVGLTLVAAVSAVAAGITWARSGDQAVADACASATDTLSSAVIASVDPGARENVASNLAQFVERSRASGDEALVEAALDLQLRLATVGGDSFETYFAADKVRAICADRGHSLGRLGPDISLSTNEEQTACLIAQFAFLSATRLDERNIRPLDIDTSSADALGVLARWEEAYDTGGWPEATRYLGEESPANLIELVVMAHATLPSISPLPGDLERALEDFMEATRTGTSDSLINASQLVSNRCFDRGFFFPQLSDQSIDDFVCSIVVRGGREFLSPDLVSTVGGCGS